MPEGLLIFHLYLSIQALMEDARSLTSSCVERAASLCGIEEWLTPGIHQASLSLYPSILLYCWPFFNLKGVVSFHSISNSCVTNKLEISLTCSFTHIIILTIKGIKEQERLNSTNQILSITCPLIYTYTYICVSMFYYLSVHLSIYLNTLLCKT